MMLLFALVFLLGLSYNDAISLTEFQEKVKSAKVKTDEIISSIFTKWQVKDYPNFLRSAGMTHTAWEVLKLKYEAKILSAALGTKEKFVVSFMGSSVTAGHDSLFNQSFAILTGKVMEAPFNILGVEFETRNAAMGNNPCLPYDVCVHAFAGKDADIVHWEQTFNCGEDDSNKHVEFEQFIRQSQSLPNQAVVVFSSSITPNWEAKDCEGDKIKPISAIPSTDKERLLMLEKDPIDLVQNMNLKEHMERFTVLKGIFAKYKTAGLQTWMHDAYEAYKCHGPYNKDWGCCSASWHPSLKGHELRSDHYAYFWLLIFRDALDSLLKIDNIEEAQRKVTKHIQNERKLYPAVPMYESKFTEGLTCYTTFLPINDESLSLFNLVLSKEPVDGKQPFKTGIMEDFLDTNIVKKAKSQGYLDYKRVLYGNNRYLPLSFKVEVAHTGYIHICETPGNWGVLPKGFKSFYKGFAEAYITSGITSYDDWKFDQSKAVKHKFIGGDGSQMVCSQLDGIFAVGKYVLTVVPTGDEKIMISYLIIP